MGGTAFGIGVYTGNPVLIVAGAIVDLKESRDTIDKLPEKLKDKVLHTDPCHSSDTTPLDTLEDDLDSMDRRETPTAGMGRW